MIFEGVQKRYFNINIEKKSLFSKITKAWDIVLVPLKRAAVGNKNVLQIVGNAFIEKKL